ncbi:hypothetical protein GGR51DRAFT_111372 [Nemania sp. FL0031]|nr:hypothetical protein GGR51DRAFT_111372 [Nemania sp. FL0031]
MASLDSSNGSSHYANVQTFRAFKSKDHQGESVERANTDRMPSITYNHRARAYEPNAPSPRYTDSSSYKPKKNNR